MSGVRLSTAADVMSAPAVAVAPGASFASVAELLYTAAVRAVPVLDSDGRLLGVVSEADLLVTAERGDPRESRRWWRPRHVRRPGPEAKAGATTAADLMTTPVVTIGPDASVARAARTMREHRLSWLPVVDGDDHVVGVLGRSDLLALFLRDDAAIRDEVVTEVFGRMLLVDPAQIAVSVADGVVTVTGKLEKRGDTVTAVRLVERLEGVVGVHDRLSYRIDERLADSRVAPLY
jgi:CBS-domain-containing membrane protein